MYRLTFVCTGVNHLSVLPTERQCTCTTSFKMKTKMAVTYCKYLPSTGSLCYSSHLSVLPTERQCTTRLPCYCQSGLRPHTKIPLIFLIYQIYINISYITYVFNRIDIWQSFPEQLFVEVIWKCRWYFWTVVRNKVYEQLLLSGTNWMHICYIFSASRMIHHVWSVEVKSSQPNSSLINKRPAKTAPNCTGSSPITPTPSFASCQK